MENRSTASFSAALLDRRLFLLGASALVLSACSNVIGPPDAPQIYVLRPVVPAAAVRALFRVIWMPDNAM